MSLSIRIGVVGTGFIAGSLIRLIQSKDNYQLTAILTRRDLKTSTDFPGIEIATNSINELIDKVDLIVECSGTVNHATEIANAAVEACLPVITMNSEFHTTTGSYFADKLYLSEAEGDQPGCIAALNEECIKMGFTPLVLGNFKGFLNTNPSVDDMQYWSEIQGITIKQTTSFTDGTKVQIEQAFVANGLEGTILQMGLSGPKSDDYVATAKDLAKTADVLGQPVSDYIISDTGLPAGVFIAAKHNNKEHKALQYYKLGEGPYYVLTKNYHLCAFEILKTVDRYLLGLPPLLNNSSSPKISIASIAKCDLTPGEKIVSGIGGFEVRGEAVLLSDDISHVPIGILENAIVTRKVEAGQVLTYDDIELVPSLALDITQKLFTKN